MANTTAESAFQRLKLKSTKKKVAQITVFDGHVADAKDIQKAINNGYTNFYNLENRERYCCETNLLCSKEPLTAKERRDIDEELDT